VSAATPSIPKLEAPGRVTFSRVLLSEWTKFRSVRSTKWSLGIAILLTIAIPLIVGAAVYLWQKQAAAYREGNFDPTAEDVPPQPETAPADQGTI